MKKVFIYLILGVTALTSGSVSAGPDDTAYFNQFLFRKESTGSDPDFPTYAYRYLMSNYKAMYKRDDGVYVNPWISLMLFADGTFWMQYNENYFKNPDDIQFNPGPCRIIEGSWAVPNTQIEISHLIVGDRTIVENMNAIDIKFLKNIVSPGLTSTKFDLTLGTSNSDPRQSPFCW